ncbi:DNA repair protein RadA, partial [Patescibacteria group bacterium]
MSKQSTIYICSKCDGQFPKWQGRCSECGAWGTVAETQKPNEAGAGKNKTSAYPDNARIVNLSDIKGGEAERIKIGIEEIDRVLGGGIVPGSLILLGGEPGIGKSTIVLQIAEKLNTPPCPPLIKGRSVNVPPLANVENVNVLYVSGEESAEQIKLRMDRLKINSQAVQFLSETNVESICGAIQKHKPALAIIDSIQTVYSNEISAEAGNVSQIRAATAKLMGVAKMPISSSPENSDDKNPAIIIIGHITKDGSVAGPKTLEHLVDTVLYLEGERYHTYRLLRTVKNRFGSTNEIGVFEMSSLGLQEVKNPSALFMEEHKEKLPGTIIASVMEGTRPFLIEIQALATTTHFGYPQRKVSGYDLNRLQLLLAVLQKRMGLNFGNKDVYLNIVGGFKIQEPSADLAVCLALISALKNIALHNGAVAFGEVGLGGEIRQVSQHEKRITEATKLGFKNIICPKNKKTSTSSGNIKVGT